MRVVFDSSAIISISQTCLINVIGGLRERMNAEFYIPKAVFDEAVKRPISIKRFELNAIRIKRAIQMGWFRVAGVSNKRLFDEIGEAANNCFFAKGRAIRLLQLGEIEGLALIKELGAKAFAIDERTTRMLVEDPKGLQGILQARRHVDIKVDSKKASVLGSLFIDLTFVRSVELLALSSELGLLDEELPKGRQSLEAALFAAKYSGCAVSGKEIKAFMRGGQ